MHKTQNSPSLVQKILHNDSSGGLILIAMAILALIMANSPLAPLYFNTLNHYIGGLSILHWINDGLMALFFLLVGLEVKRELINGQLSENAQRVLPGIAAFGGMFVPALIYVGFNLSEGGNLSGWAIPAATDIAFALGVLSLLGPRVPISLKIFLTALAIIDDIGAVLIIALFYTSEVNLLALGCVVVLTTTLVLLNRLNITKLSPYLIIGALLWYFMLKSGIHATIAGVLLALTIPHKLPSVAFAHSPLIKLEHKLHLWIAFLIIPIFGFANAGVSFTGISLAILKNPITLGVMLGLFLGKQVGVFLFSFIAIKLNIAKLPEHASFTQLYGISLLCGIGFTMSLFIGLLAFPDSQTLQDATKLGVIMGSIISAIIGTLVLKRA